VRPDGIRFSADQVDGVHIYFNACHHGLLTLATRYQALRPQASFGHIYCTVPQHGTTSLLFCVSHLCSSSLPSGLSFPLTANLKEGFGVSRHVLQSFISLWRSCLGWILVRWAEGIWKNKQTRLYHTILGRWWDHFVEIKLVWLKSPYR
jgi:hypothetical protein